ncbi:uncharacterized protein L969DRAFT_526239 [Mixia osmundae IAM 14324]|uniref:Uncharacterized protein n=1 Tax=Mixia osmundae (strain CBS 9802 / IAM 14324 / JCM 22182 / KY 12970) TaxID=764103 RepID=G7E0E3_MIXOS|nr:uncharacterized protein L969DRAFT_526239 [Mixia osmundae IAM 14324]KEI38312.1 hypothetical protein L969DRAFT_526239 [Mixia osmundae IAM 14324]GAA96303.1 hypothetical protein E5Q_02969 [Mixia osmundae IAM 14324]
MDLRAFERHEGKLVYKPAPGPPDTFTQQRTLALSDALKSALLAMGKILSFIRDVRALQAQGYVSRVPLQLNEALEQACERYQAICDCIEHEALVAKAVIQRDTERGTSSLHAVEARLDPQVTPATSAVEAAQPERQVIEIKDDDDDDVVQIAKPTQGRSTTRLTQQERQAQHQQELLSTFGHTLKSDVRQGTPNMTLGEKGQPILPLGGSAVFGDASNDFALPNPNGAQAGTAAAAAAAAAADYDALLAMLPSIPLDNTLTAPAPPLNSKAHLPTLTADANAPGQSSTSFVPQLTASDLAELENYSVPPELAAMLASL